jgi:hypothetical protein
MSRNDAVEDAIKARLGPVFQGARPFRPYCLIVTGSELAA